MRITLKRELGYHVNASIILGGCSQHPSPSTANPDFVAEREHMVEQQLAATDRG